MTHSTVLDTQTIYIRFSGACLDFYKKHENSSLSLETLSKIDLHTTKLSKTLLDMVQANMPQKLIEVWFDMLITSIEQVDTAQVKARLEDRGRQKEKDLYGLASPKSMPVSPVMGITKHINSQILQQVYQGNRSLSDWLSLEIDNCIKTGPVYCENYFKNFSVLDEKYRLTQMLNSNTPSILPALPTEELSNQTGGTMRPKNKI